MTSPTAAANATATSLAFLPRSTSKKFPFCLHAALGFAERHDLTDVAAWLPGGKAFAIFDQEKFSQTILREVFRHGNFRSFLKQTSNWGFDRSTDEKGNAIFSHELFQRGRKSLCQGMVSKSTRTKTAETAKKTVSNDLSAGTAKALPTPGADERSAALATALAKAMGRAGGSPAAAQAQQPVSAPSRLLELRNHLANVAASSPAAANALMVALQKRVAAKSAMAAAATNANIPSSEDLAVALAKAAVQRSAALERFQLQQEFQRQQQALLREHQKLEAQQQQQYEANLQLLLAAHQNRQQQNAPAPAAPSTALLDKLVKDRKEEEERAAALLALRVPR
jgi:HSF-type DNA-binding